MNNNMKETIVIERDAAYGRNAYLKIVGNKVVFDDSEEEYGPIEFDLSLLEQKIKEHKDKISSKY